MDKHILMNSLRNLFPHLVEDLDKISNYSSHYEMLQEWLGCDAPYEKIREVFKSYYTLLNGRKANFAEQVYELFVIFYNVDAPEFKNYSHKEFIESLANFIWENQPEPFEIHDFLAPGLNYSDIPDRSKLLLQILTLLGQFK